MKSSQEVVKFYQRELDKFGDDARSVNWGSQESQELRFKILLEGKVGHTVCDVGCGLGHFYKYIKQNYPLLVSKYYGVDITPGYIEMAKKNYPDAEFICGDFLEMSEVPEVDTYLLSGTLAYLGTADNHKAVREMIKKMWDHSRVSLNFNIPSTRVDKGYENSVITYHEPIEIVSFCCALCNEVTYIHSYAHHEFTILMNR